VSAHRPDVDLLETPPRSDQRPVKRSLSLYGHRTSVTLEPVFWRALERMAAQKGLSLNAVAGRIDAARDPDATLAGALRVAILDWALRQRPSALGSAGD
jgi:predicted DNA-binding ribbon-helix-helix protein